MKRIRTILLIIIAGVFLSALFVPQRVGAVSCKDYGWVGISSDKAVLEPAQSATINVVFKWQNPNMPAGCFDQDVTLTIWVGDPDKGGHSIYTKGVGKVPKGGQKDISYGLSYDAAKSVSKDGKAEITARATTYQGFFSPEIISSANLFINVYDPALSAYACIDAQQKWRCSKDNTMDGCKRDPGCQINPKAPCQLLADRNDCGRVAPASTTTGPSPTSTAGGGGGKTVTFDFSIPNPLKSENLLELIQAVGSFIFNLSIPIAVIMIVYAGVLFLISRGDQAKVSKAREILKYAIIGLAIVLIGSGFISLITSILNLGGGSGGGSGAGNIVTPTQTPIAGGYGNNCKGDNDCHSPWECLPQQVCGVGSGRGLGERCQSNQNCDPQLWCNLTPDAIRIFDGQQLGLCAFTGGEGYPCTSGSDCQMGSKCINNVCTSQ